MIEKTKGQRVDAAKLRPGDVIRSMGANYTVRWINDGQIRLYSHQIRREIWLSVSNETVKKAVYWEDE